MCRALHAAVQGRAGPAAHRWSGSVSTGMRLRIFSGRSPSTCSNWWHGVEAIHSWEGTRELWSGLVRLVRAGQGRRTSALRAATRSGKPAPPCLLLQAPDHEVPLQPLAQLSQVAGAPAQAAARGAAAWVHSATSHAPRGTEPKPKLPQAGAWEAPALFARLKS